jgi:hypothetical protein
MEAYCMKCRAKREIKNPKQITHKNGKEAVTGTCAVCNTKIFRMGKLQAAATATAKAASNKAVTAKKSIKVG